MANKTGKGGFKKGQSGNPGGVTKDAKNMRELARSYSDEAIGRLAHWMRSEDPKASQSAAVALLNRAWGTPAQSVEVSGPEGGPQVHQFVDAPPQETRDEWEKRQALKLSGPLAAKLTTNDPDD